MATRHKLGVLFYFDTSWMGGIIYIQNLIRTLDYLEDEKKPEILLFYRPGLKKFAEEIEYPYLTKIEYSFLPIWKRYVYSWIKGENEFVSDIIKNYELNSLFPIHDFPTNSKLAEAKRVNLVSWFADFQYKHYPSFFSLSQRIFKDFRMFLIKKNCDSLVLSSESVAKDVFHYYSVKPNKINIFHFVSIIGAYKQDNPEELKIKYKLPDNYFIVSNQFHKHKNHKIVIEAIHELNQIGHPIHVAFTGKLPFDTKAQHILELHDLIERYNLKDQITILGLMPRDEQLLLMKNAQAVIQPSFFEGWSTVVEDAMALNVPVIASNLDVNIEQLKEKGIYFNPNQTFELVQAIKKFGERDFSTDFFGDYDNRIKDAAKTFLSIIKGEKRKRILQINSSVNLGSSGRIVEEIAALSTDSGFENYIAYSKGIPSQTKIFYVKIGSLYGKLWHGLLTLLFDAHGRGSIFSTKKLLKEVERIKPDLIHLHNLHGYFINYPLLFSYLNKTGIQVVWTLHDCWSFTGHCSHFENIGCNKWETKCFKCPKKNKYPKSLFLDNSENNYNKKKKVFNSIENMVLVSPSKWLNVQIGKSFLSKSQRRTINNGINLDIFKANVDLVSELRNKYNLNETKVALCVAFNWSNTKGISDIISVSKMLPKGYRFIIVGLTEDIMAELPEDIIAISKTNDLGELANWYALADVFVNPTYIDTFPTTNLESLACGTPIITYSSGGSPEAIDTETGVVLEKGDLKGMLDAIVSISQKGKTSFENVCRKRAEIHFDMNTQFRQYTSLYKELLLHNN